jgi:hypothetical protein
MKKIILILLFICNVVVLFAQRKTTYKVLSNTSNETIIDIQMGDINQKNIATPYGDAVKISIDKGTAMLEKGYPDLPKLAFSIIVPNNKKSTIAVLENEFIDYKNVFIAPSKGKIYRNEDPDLIPFTMSPQYSKNEFYPASIANLNQPFIIRDYRGQNIHVNPIQYNPITKTLRVYMHLKIKMTYEGISSENSIPNDEKISHVVEEFDNIYANQFLNYKTASTLYSPLSQQGSMLIICPANYLPEIASYNKWKQMKGIQTFLVNTDTLVGGVNENSMYELVQAYYHTHKIAYVTIVGDHANIPTMLGLNKIPNLKGPSDNAYGYMTNSDHYPEIIVGRISGETKEEIATQVNRTLMYEKTPNTSSNWVQKQVGMSSDQGPGDDNQFDYEHICDILDSNKNHYHYINNPGYFDGDQMGCNDAIGSPSPGDLINEFNAGFGLLNYCGHGSTASFTTSGFAISDISSLQNNTGKWPFIFSTACVNGNFMFQTCLAESLLRAKDNTSGNPQGAIAALMSTINQSWDPPMQGQDEMNAIMRGARINNKKSTFGALVANGNMSVMENYNSLSNPQDGDEIADTWTVFGDPSVEVRTKHEGVLTCSHSGWIQQNSTDLYLSCNVDGATIGLYYKGKYWGSTTVFGGVAHITFDALTDLDSLLITATKQNYVPYLGNAMVVNYPASVQTLEHNLNVFVFPNPFNEQIEVSTKDHAIIQSFEIVDMSGKVILAEKANAASLKINTESISKGFYIAKITTQKGLVIQKLVK